MKRNIHPQTHPVIFVDESTGEEIISTSTMTSGETKEIDGVTYYVIRMDITALSHPYFTGEMRFVDTQGRVDKFMQKMKKAQELKKKKQPKKKAGKNQNQEVKSYQEILKEQQLELKKAAKTKSA